MLFNSLGFVIFFPTVFFLYYLLRGKARTVLLLLASSYFYMAFVPKYIFVLFFLITFDYFIARKIESSVTQKKFYFVLSILSNVGALFIFKYFNFFNENVAILANTLGWNYSLESLSIILPIGLSFHIFQSLAYIIEVYKGRYKAERNYLTYALYVMFFPQLVAGPIERPAHLIPQLKREIEFSYTKAISGLRLILWGFFKKVVIANRLAILVDFVYSNMEIADGSTVLVAVAAFSIQLYADFSGYSDIAIGSARMLGIELTENFRQPYFSRSIKEFWQRWHISLSTWFRDYVYYPLVWKYGRSKSGLYACIIITFMLTGLWHGAGWNFLLMGVIFGVYISFGEWTKPWRDHIKQVAAIKDGLLSVIQKFSVFILATVAWIFFRAENIAQVKIIFHKLFFEWTSNAFSFLSCTDYCAVYALGVGRKTLLIHASSAAILLLTEFVQTAYIPLPSFTKKRPFRWAFYYGLIFWTLGFGYFAQTTFIYFQF